MIRMSLQGRDNDASEPSYASPATIQNKIRLLIVDYHPLCVLA
jgi:hypothetical protein